MTDIQTAEQFLVSFESDPGDKLRYAPWNKLTPWRLTTRVAGEVETTLHADAEIHNWILNWLRRKGENPSMKRIKSIAQAAKIAGAR